ncbi:TetR/AcrR family transcriptional regulator [Gordonia sp. VNK21]|uniref:TetR/AcrR family transcriptional regulator n=1 Tax=Gordonia sp. VNK21 TaxID=3382483 RepID=UPI0038D458A7
MTDTPAPRSARAARDRLLGAAIEAFAQRGFHGTTTRDLAAAAGMSPAAVYVHYRTKEELLFEISLTGHRYTLATIEAADDPGATPPQRLHAVMHAFALHHAVDHTAALVVNYEMAALAEEHRQQIREIRAQINALIRGIVDAGVADGVFRIGDPRTATLALVSMGVDIARWYRPGRELSAGQIADFYAELALRTVDSAETNVVRDTP